MLVLATVFQLVDPVLTIAAALSVQSPFLRVTESSETSLERRHQFDSEHGDPFTLLHAYDEWVQIKATQRESSKKWAKRHFTRLSNPHPHPRRAAPPWDLYLLLYPAPAPRPARAPKLAPPSEPSPFDPPPHGLRRGRDSARERDRERIAKRRQLRLLQMQRETERGRRVLSLDDHFPTDDGPANAEGAETFVYPL
eukprot:tig00000215_g18571.t1